MPASTAHGPSRCGSLGTETRAARPLIKSQRPLFQTEMLPAPISDVRSGAKCEILIPSGCLPLCLRTRTLLDAVGTSHLCQHRESPQHPVGVLIPRAAEAR